MFAYEAPGRLVAIRDRDPVLGEWEHRAFVPDPLGEAMPALDPRTFMRVADARAALAALDNTARQLPNPTLLRLPTLRREAQSTSALEGTYAPLADVLIADEDDPQTAELVEILNYVRAANHGFEWVSDGRPFSVAFFSDLQGLLMRGTPLAGESGRLRDGQVVIGRRGDADPAGFPVHNARFVPPPPGDDLQLGVQALADWMRVDRRADIDPVVGAAMSHYQLEALHPFRDGNGRIGSPDDRAVSAGGRCAERADPDRLAVVRGTTRRVLRRASRSQHSQRLGRIRAVLRRRPPAGSGRNQDRDDRSLCGAVRTQGPRAVLASPCR